MSNPLRSRIADLASTFASSIASAIRGANFDDILALAEGDAQPGRRGPGRPRGKTTKAEKATGKTAVTTAPDSAPLKKATGGRLQRRSPAEIAKALAQVVALVKSDADGLRAEHIRDRLGMASKEMPRVLKEGLAKKVLKSKGAKRSTTYTAG